MRYIVLDTETTGLSAQNGDRILEIGCIELVNRRLTGNDRHFYINPERDSHEDALRVHGITSEFLKDKPLFKEIAQDFLDFIKGAKLIIHNASFDVGFINKEFELLAWPNLEEHGIEVVDTLALARQTFPGKRNSLDALCERLEVDNSGRILHGALLDAQLLADVYINLTRGQHALIADEGTENSKNEQANGEPRVDLSGLQCPVIRPTAEELALHEGVMKEIAKESDKNIAW